MPFFIWKAGGWRRVNFVFSASCQNSSLVFCVVDGSIHVNFPITSKTDVERHHSFVSASYKPTFCCYFLYLTPAGKPGGNIASPSSLRKHRTSLPLSSPLAHSPPFTFLAHAHKPHSSPFIHAEEETLSQAYLLHIHVKSRWRGGGRGAALTGGGDSREQTGRERGREISVFLRFSIGCATASACAVVRCRSPWLAAFLEGSPLRRGTRPTPWMDWKSGWREKVRTGHYVLGVRL